MCVCAGVPTCSAVSNTSNGYSSLWLEEGRGRDAETCHSPQYFLSFHHSLTYGKRKRLDFIIELL